MVLNGEWWLVSRGSYLVSGGSITNTLFDRLYRNVGDAATLPDYFPLMKTCTQLGGIRMDIKLRLNQAPCGTCHVLP